MTGRVASASLAVWLIGVVGCKARTQSAPVVVEASGDGASAGLTDRPRCQPPQQVSALGAPGTDVEVGSAIQSGSGLALALAHSGAGEGRFAAVALLTPDASAVRLVDLGPLRGDAPPPRIAWRGVDGKDLVVVAELGTGLSVLGLGGDGNRKLLFKMQDVPPDSAVDVAASADRGIVVWEATASLAKGRTRGVVRAAMFEGAGRAGPTAELSSADSDVDSPRVVASRSGYFVVWTARGTEPLVVTDGGSAVAEVASESHVPRWLEVVVLDNRGSPLGPPRRLTPTTGHVGSFDLMLGRVDGPGSLLVASRDDGALELVRVHSDGTSETPTTVPSEGLGAGAPNFVEGVQPWLSWAGPREQVMMLPVETSPALPSSEDSFDESQPLLANAEGKVLAVAPATSAGGTPELRVFSCSR
jgi:hypothetical protein